MRLFITAALLAVTAVTANAELPSATDAAVRQALGSGKPTVIDLGARTCIPCKKMAPILESLARIEGGESINVLYFNPAAFGSDASLLKPEVAMNFHEELVKRQDLADAPCRSALRALPQQSLVVSNSGHDYNGDGGVLYPHVVEKVQTVSLGKQDIEDDQ